MPTTDKRLFLLDAYALIYRAYYALIRAPRITSQGFNTSAIFGFCNTLDEILRKENPTHIAVCFDVSGPTFRDEMFPDYKAQRDAQPEDITLSIPYIKDIIRAYNIAVIEKPGYEADDVIGTLAHRAQAEGFTTYMMTPDKDYGQLVTDRVLMYRPSLKGRDFEIRGPKEVCERYGIESPHQVIDLLALEGDVSDNIPGCPGVGEKTAVKLINQFGSVEKLIENVDELKGALRLKVADNIEKIRMSKVLATICTDVPIDLDLDSLERKPENVDRLRELFTELEFKSFLGRLKGSSQAVESTPPSTPTLQGSLFDFDAEASETPTPSVAQTFEFKEITSIGEAAKVVAQCAAAKEFGWALYAPGPDAMTARARSLALAVSADAPVNILHLPSSETAERAEWLVMLQPLFSSPATLVGFDLKRDMVVLASEGVKFDVAYFDVAIAHYLLQPEMRHRLSDIAMAYLGHATADALDPATSRSKNPYPELPREMIAPRLAETALLSMRLRPVLLARIEETDQTKLLNEIEMPLVKVLADMEVTGVRIDVKELNQMSVQLTERLNALEQEAYQLAGHPFKLGSPKQVGEVLFDELKIDPKAKRTKSGTYSTTEEILESYRTAHPLVDIILRVRSLSKLLATYINALPELINQSTGKIHTTFNQTVTATGRISSSNPNLQNIPIRTDDGREIRRAFIADPGCLILSADYSQIELRLMAHFANDPDMIAAFTAGEDIHRATAAKIYHLPLDQVDDTLRRNAKTANFGIIYGISAFGLSQRLGIPRSEAKTLIDGYFNSYPSIAQYIEGVTNDARANGYVTTIYNRRRYLPDINSRNAGLRGFAERNAVNAPLQGSAADIIKRAMIDINRMISERGLRSRMILQVHDELIFNVYPDELAELQSEVTRLMENAFSGRVRLEVASGVATNWLQAH
ncbi:MAG: DNA polymerase I [Muribaculaceae bacterium]|nr:DNA polymerase I [Muribaculaceae bacterium]